MIKNLSKNDPSTKSSIAFNYKRICNIKHLQYKRSCRRLPTEIPTVRGHKKHLRVIQKTNWSYKTLLSAAPPRRPEALAGGVQGGGAPLGKKNYEFSL